MTSDELVIVSLRNLRDELIPRAFSDNGRPINCDLAEVVWKINSCLKGGYKLSASQIVAEEYADTSWEGCVDRQSGAFAPEELNTSEWINDR